MVHRAMDAPPPQWECPQPTPGHGGVHRGNRPMEAPYHPGHFKNTQNQETKPIKGDHSLTHNNEKNHQDDRRARFTHLKEQR